MSRPMTLSRWATGHAQHRIDLGGEAGIRFGRRGGGAGVTRRRLQAARRTEHQVGPEGQHADRHQADFDQGLLLPAAELDTRRRGAARHRAGRWQGLGRQIGDEAAADPCRSRRRERRLASCARAKARTAQAAKA